MVLLASVVSTVKVGILSQNTVSALMVLIGMDIAVFHVLQVRSGRISLLLAVVLKVQIGMVSIV